MPQFQFDTATSDGVAVGTTSTLVLTANSARKIAIITNDSNVNMYLSLGVPAEINKGVRLSRGGGSFTTQDDYPFKGNIYMIAGSANKNVSVLSA